jgi:hypothetical protein
MSKNYLYIAIVILLLVIVGGGAYFLSNRHQTNVSQPSVPATTQTSPTQPASATPTPTTPTAQTLSEQPNQAKFNEYFTSVNLAKFPKGQKFNPFAVVPTSVFSLATDQLCTSLSIIKTIPSGSFAYAIYDTVNKDYIMPKGIFPHELKSGGSIGCSDLTESVGKYEYKIYVDDVLAIVLPFTVVQ